ncbi:MAG: mandelate racemase/muconate lactonizing enzyme family protein [Candidatus Solibacter usitatus]|nr:mandelate racemase/muconate lactonizing enzyme family protein [Candidatus Solibacter usitatus]
MFRRDFFKTAAAGFAMGSLPLHTKAAALKGMVKITDVKCMIVRGTWDWNLVKIETDAGVYGIGEAYWGYGVKDLILKQLKPLVLGEDPLNVDMLYTKMLMRSAGAGALAGVTVTAASGIEIALWDLAGRLLETPSVNLLGGRFRDKVRFYRTLQTVDNVEDMRQWRAQVREARAEKMGWTAFKFQGDGIPPKADPTYSEPGHDRYTRGLTLKDLRRIAKAMETVRDELGPDTDFGVEAHWKYDVRDAIQMAKAIEPAKPMWLEDPVPPGNPEAMARVTHAVDVPICTGENLYTRDGFRRLIELQGCDVVHIDIPKSGGLLESKRIHDLADNYYIWTAAHNPASPVGTIASCHAAASMRTFRVHELAKYVDWWQDLVIHDGPIFENGYYRIREKPGFGVELNPDVAKKNLAPGESWWG